MTKNQKTSLFSNRSSRRSEKRAPRSTSLRFEALENRELLSVNAADYAQLRESFEQLALPALTAEPFQNANVAAAPTLADGEVCASLLEPMWTPLTAPTLRVESTAGGVVTLAWDAVANAGGYQLMARVAGENLYDVLTFEADETSVTLDDCDADKTYEFRIMAIGSGDVYASSDYGEPVLVHVYAESLRVTGYDAESRVATLEWGAISGATTYTVKLSKDGGASWTTYRKNLPTTSTTVSGQYVGKTYKFRVYGYNSTGGQGGDYLELTFAPISATTSVQNYTVGTPITVTLSPASAHASATIQWYFVTNEDDVEIVEARDQLTYTPTTDDYDIKVVTTGTGDSKGCTSTQTISRPIEAAALRVKSYDPEARVAELKWGAISGASKYTVKLSKDGGATWTNYKTNLTGTNVTVNGLYTGKAYAFRVIGIASDGTTLDGGSEVAFAPVSATSSVQDYTVGTPITLKVSAAANASATVRWYFVTNNGDEEIVSARNRLSYVPTSADYDIKVVTTGTGDSAPCVYTQTIARPVDAAPITVRSYDAETRIATIRWDSMPDAATYTVKISRDGGATWVDYIKKIPSKNNYKGINGIYAGRSYDFRVYGIASDGTALKGYAAGTVAPVALSSTTTSYSVGSTITVRQTGAENASATIKWYRVTPTKDVEIVSARDQLRYTPPTADYDIKVVATGTGDSKGCNSELTFTAPEEPEEPEAISVTSYDASTRVATLEWLPIAGATKYTVKLSKNDGATWTNYKTGMTTTSATVNGLYVGKTCVFRVYGYANYEQVGDYLELTYTPTSDSSALLDEYFADFFEEELFEEF